jgi:hypothetical protein
MKSTSFLFVFIIFFMYLEIDAYAQADTREPIRVYESENNPVMADNKAQDKVVKDSSQQKKKVIVIDYGQMEELNKKSMETMAKIYQSPQFEDINKKLMEARIQVLGGRMGGDKDMSELRLTKSFKGESVETTKKFSVTADNTSLNFNLSGQVKSGIISVTLFKPNGSKYKAIEIDPTSDISYSQGIDLKKDPKECTGDWQIKIKADKADGNYRLNILTR